MENMSAIFMDIDTLDIFTIHIAAQLRPLVDDKAFLSCLLCKMGESGTEEAGAHY
jgi:hypothetical protein